MKSFELHTYKDGKWKIDSIFDDRELAIFEARRVEASSRYSGVRVIEEKFDEASDSVTNRTLFRGGAAKGQKSTEIEENVKSKRSATRRGTGKKTARNGETKSKAKKSNSLNIVLVLLVILFGGLAALFGLQHLSSMR